MPRDLLADKPRDLLAKAAPAENQGRSILDVAQSVTPLGMAQQAVEFAQDPSAGLQRADDFMRGAAGGLTFGFADKVAGYLGREGEEAERAKTEAARQRNPLDTAIGEIGGSVLSAGKLMNAGATASNLIPQAFKGSMAARSAATAADALALNELMNLGHGREVGENALLAAGTGAAAPIAGALISKGASKLAGIGQKKPVIPTRDQIAAAADRAYDAADDAGGIFAARDVDDLIRTVRTKMANEGYLPENQPGVKAALKAIKRYKGQNVTFKGLEQLRRAVSKGYRWDNKDNNRMLHQVVETIDDFAQSKGSAGYAEARKLFAQRAKMDSVANAIELGQKRAARTGSGGNVDNAIRQEIGKVAKRQRGYTPDERAALVEAEEGTVARNLARAVGAMGPSGNGLGKMLWGGALLGGGLAAPTTIAPIAAAGLGTALARKGGQVATRKAAERVAKIVAAGGTKAATQAPKTATQAAIEQNRDLIARILMLGGVSGLAAQ